MYTTNLVVKVASRCNLNCTYCYVYNMGDNSYKLQPKFMSIETIKKIFERIKSHCLNNGLKDFLIIFHGGEPLLAGLDFYKNFIEIGKSVLKNDITIDYGMQTNGVLLDYNLAVELKKLKIQVGISIDGTEGSNNKNRIYHNNKGSYTEIINGFNIIKEVYGDKLANCICVIDTDESPFDVYKHFKEIGARSVHFLFPDNNFKNTNYEDIPKVGEWLVLMFDLWYNDSDLNKPSIRPLTDLIGLILGYEKYSEIFGKGKNNTLVIETNGDIETTDSLKICGDGFTKTKLNVENNEFDEIYKSSNLAKQYYNGHDDLCTTCKNCFLEEICGGGFIGHRYSKENEFDNPSIYCKQIALLICHIQNQIILNLPPEIVANTKIQKLSYEEVIENIQNSYN